MKHSFCGGNWRAIPLAAWLAETDCECNAPFGSFGKQQVFRRTIVGKECTSHPTTAYCRLAHMCDRPHGSLWIRYRGIGPACHRKRRRFALRKWRMLGTGIEWNPCMRAGSKLSLYSNSVGNNSFYGSFHRGLRHRVSRIELRL